MLVPQDRIWRDERNRPLKFLGKWGDSDGVQMPDNAAGRKTGSSSTPRIRLGGMMCRMTVGGYCACIEWGEEWRRFDSRPLRRSFTGRIPPLQLELQIPDLQVRELRLQSRQQARFVEADDLSPSRVELCDDHRQHPVSNRSGA